MARYMETAAKVRKEAEALLVDIEHLIFRAVGQEEIDPEAVEEHKRELAKRIGYIVNLAIRACPRGVQGTVRKNIVQEAVKDYCHVTMTRETDERTGREYNKIHITSKG